LLAIKRLQQHEASRESILKPLSAAGRSPVNARAANISAENRFDAACKVIMQCATTVVDACRYFRQRLKYLKRLFLAGALCI
jgi:hypothetical protein